MTGRISDAPASDATADIVAAVQAAWAGAFARWDLDALVALYAADALFFGSLPERYLGQSGIRAYFSKLPAGVFKSAAFGEQQAIRLAPDVIATAGPVTFAREVDGQVGQVPFRISLTLVRQGQAWKIASHHASPRGP